MKKDQMNTFSRNFKNNCDFSWNPGNSYVPLQPELCPDGSEL